MLKFDRVVICFYLNERKVNQITSTIFNLGINMEKYCKVGNQE